MNTRRWSLAIALLFAATMVGGYVVATASADLAPASTAVSEATPEQAVSECSTSSSESPGRAVCGCVTVADCWATCCEGAVNALCQQNHQCRCQW